MSWYVEVRHNSKPRVSKHVEQGGEVTVRFDPDRYAKARLAKAVAIAARSGRSIPEDTQAGLMELYRAEALEKSHV